MSGLTGIDGLIIDTLLITLVVVLIALPVIWIGGLALIVREGFRIWRGQ